MEFIDKDAMGRIVHGLMEDLSVLQIKVGALESLLLNDKAMHAKYTELVKEQAEALIRERKNRTIDNLAQDTSPGTTE